MTDKQKNILRPTAEIEFALELEELKKNDPHLKPEHWLLSPWAVLQYILGTTLPDGFIISPKYFGPKRIVEIAIASLLSDRALLLTGIPGTAKTWLAEHLTAAISGDSTILIQGTNGTSEDQMKYGWNYASLIAKGPSYEALIPSPIMTAMLKGSIARIEELSRIPSETQDALLSILSEKAITIPELNQHIHATRGFNIIGTSNDLDRGIFEMSSALKRRFNILTMPLPKSVEDELQIVSYRVQQMGRQMEIPLSALKEKQILKLVTLFRELRDGKSQDGKTKIKATKTQLSPAVAISLVHEARIYSYYFDENEIKAEHLAEGLIQSLKQEDIEEIAILEEYNETILKKRNDYKDWYKAIKEKI